MMFLAVFIAHFEAGPATERINEWGAAAGYSVGGHFDTMAAYQTRAVHCGCDDLLQVLTLMLRGSGLKFVVLRDRVISIIQEGK